jgi:hypothetical protein
MQSRPCTNQAVGFGFLAAAYFSDDDVGCIGSVYADA